MLSQRGLGNHKQRCPLTVRNTTCKEQTEMNPYQTIEVLMGVIYSLKEQMAKMEVNCTECVRMSEPCTTQTTDQVIEA